MNYHYPERISDDDVDDDDTSSCHSSELEGGGISDKLTSFERRSHSHGAKEGVMITRGSSTGHDDAYYFDSSSTEFYTGATKYGDKDDIMRFGRDGDLDASFNTDSCITQIEQNTNEIAAMIQRERNRRLGVQENVEPTNHTVIISSSAPFPERVFGNFRGWFGSGGGSATTANPNGEQSSFSHHASLSTHSTHKSKQDEDLHDKPQEIKNIFHDGNSSLSNPTEESSSDDDSSSASSSISHLHDDANFTPQERARERALRYLSNSCVDSGRKSKTASYVWGLEQLDLTRKRDRLAKELEIVESEMNKDHRLSNHTGEGDQIPQMAEMLVRELPRIQGADAGAGIELDNSYFMTWEEYLNAMNSDSNPYPSVWANKGAVDLYVDSLQRRLREAVDRTRSLEKRLVVLENAGDDIVSSLCEDLAEITEHSYKTEARYIKKGKKLQRKRRREELRHRVKIKQAEHRVHALEAQLMAVNGNTQINEHTLNHTDLYEGSDTSTEDSTNNGIDDDDNEVLLEKNLSLLQLKYEQGKQIHKSELESIRRQCEQLKLHLSVARLVMEGDDNLYEYIALLERCDTNLRRGRKDGVDDTFNNRGQYELGDFIPPPPSRITRARAKLLKSIHLERIYERRLVVSKAFNDATIKALDQELVERETLSQELEVRCLNELVVTDAKIKAAQNEAIEKCSVLEKETHELQDAVSACIIQYPTIDLSLLLGGHDSFLNKELPGNKRSSRGDSPIELKESSGNVFSAEIGSTNEPEMLQSKTGVTAIVFDEPSVPLHERDHGTEQENHVIVSNGSFNNSNSSSPLVVGSQLKMIGGGFVASHSSITQIDEGISRVGRKVVSIEERERAHEQNGFPSANQFIDTNNELTDKQMYQNSTLVETPGKISVDASHPPQMASKFDEAALPNRAALKQLGCELKCTLANYQRSYNSSTSRDKIEHLDTMNDLVVRIAKLFGPTVGLENPIGVSELTSWSFKKGRKTPSEKEGRVQTRLKKKTRRRNRDETRKASKQKDGLKMQCK